MAHEGEDADGGEYGGAKGDDHLEEDANPRAAVDAGRLLDLHWHREEELPEHVGVHKRGESREEIPDDVKRLGEEPEVIKNEVGRDDRGLDRHHHHDEDDGSHRLPAGEMHPGKGVAGKRIDQEHHRYRDGAVDDGVENRAAEVLELGEQLRIGDKPLADVPAWREEGHDRAHLGEDGVIVLEGIRHHPDDREEEKEGEDGAA